MATRLYFDSVAPAAVTPSTIGSEWAHNSLSAVRRLNVNKGTSATTEIEFFYDAVDHVVDAGSLARQYVSPSLAAQSIPSQNVTLAIIGEQEHETDRLCLAMKVYLINSTGALVVGGTIIPLTRIAAGLMFADHLGSRVLTVASLPVTSSFSDRICVDVGSGGLPQSIGGTPKAHNCVLIFGEGDGFDLSQLDGGEESGDAWIEFAGSINFSDIAPTPIVLPSGNKKIAEFPGGS